MSAAMTLPTYETERMMSARDRFSGIMRPYGQADVVRLRGSVHVEYTLARLGAERLWTLLHERPYVAALGALTGNQAVQQVRAGLEAIYLSGWQVAADANTAGRMYPDQSLYPVDSVPNVVRRINAALLRADQIDFAEGKRDRHWLVPIVADAEAGFGGPLNAHELMKSMIEAGAAGVHFEDQLASEKKCGHMGGKVLVPTSQFVRTLVAARLAADIYDVPTILIARTDAESAKLITSDIDERDGPFITKHARTPEGFFGLESGVETAIARGLAYAPYADVIWCETHDAGSRASQALRGRHPRHVSKEAPRLQLLAVVQLEEEPRRRHHREVPAGARRNGIRVPIRDARGLPRAQPRHVRPRAQVQDERNGRVLRAPAGRIREREGRLHGDAPPA